MVARTRLNVFHTYIACRVSTCAHYVSNETLQWFSVLIIILEKMLTARKFQTMFSFLYVYMHWRTRRGE